MAVDFQSEPDEKPSEATEGVTAAGLHLRQALLPSRLLADSPLSPQFRN